MCGFAFFCFVLFLCLLLTSVAFSPDFSLIKMCVSPNPQSRTESMGYDPTSAIKRAVVSMSFWKGKKISPSLQALCHADDTDEISPHSLPPDAKSIIMSASPELIFLNFRGVTSLHT